MSIVLALCVAPSLVACATAKPAEPPKAAPIAYNAADFTPPSEFDMSFAPHGIDEAPAVKRSAPTASSLAPVMASRTHDAN